MVAPNRKVTDDRIDKIWNLEDWNYKNGNLENWTDKNVKLRGSVLHFNPQKKKSKSSSLLVGDLFG